MGLNGSVAKDENKKSQSGGSQSSGLLVSNLLAHLGRLTVRTKRVALLEC